MIVKSEYATRYVVQQRGVTFHPPYKDCVITILIRGKMNIKRTWMGIIPTMI